jgi:hypothetical protein
MAQLRKIPRYIAISRVTKRPIFEFVSARIHPGDALVAFTFADDYSFGILQSQFHQLWFQFRCSTLKGDSRYTGDTVYDSFPWPQSPKLSDVKAVAEASRALRALRIKTMSANKWGLKELYASLATEGKNPLKDAHAGLDAAVAKAYGCKPKEDVLKHLLDLNRSVASAEKDSKKVQGPGLPRCIKDPKPFISNDCIEP